MPTTRQRVLNVYFVFVCLPRFVQIRIILRRRKTATSKSGVPICKCHHLRYFLTERYWNWISWYLDVFPSWCRHFRYLGFLTCAPTTNFAPKRVKTRYLTLFRATKNCVVICRASLLYEMGHPFDKYRSSFLRSDTETDFPRQVRSAKRSRFAATLFIRSKPVNWVRTLPQMFMFYIGSYKKKHADTFRGYSVRSSRET